MRSKASCSATAALSATASGWSGKRAAIASGEASTWLPLARRRGSLASSVRLWRRATKASCSGAREAAWAWTLPVATQRSPSRAASARSAPVARPVAGQERALELDAQALGAEGLAQHAHAGLVMDAALRASAQADEPLGVRADRLERHRRGGGLAQALAGVGVGERQQAAEVAPAALGGDQQRQVAAVGEAQLGAVDRA